MPSGLVEYLMGAGIVGLLWRLNGLVSKQNGMLSTVVADLATHKDNDREDFQRLHDKLDELKTPPLVVTSPVGH